MVASTKIRAPRVAKGAQADDPVRMMPNDLEAEEALLGSILIDPESLSEIQAEIPNFAPEHFYREIHRDIYRALVKFGGDHIAAAGYLKDHGMADAFYTVSSLANATVTSAYAVSAARRVYNKARQRAQIGLAQAILAAGWNGDDSAFSEAILKAERLKEDYIPPAARSLKVRSMREIMQTEYPEVRMLVEKLIQQGVVTLFAGKAKAGKSFWMLAAAFAIAEACQNAFASYDDKGNELYHGLHCEQSRVLYMALEDTERRIKNRTIKMRGELAVPEFVDVATEAPRIDDALIAQLEMYLDEHPDCKLIIIDTLLKILPPPSRTGGYAEDYINLAGLRDLAHRRDVAILPLIHCRKADGSDVFDTIQTTMGTQAAAENLIVLQRRRGEDRAILHATGNDIGDEALAMKFDSKTCTWSILGDAEKVAENENEELIFGALEALEAEGKPAKLGAIAAQLKGEMGFSNVRSMVYRMSAIKPNSPVKNKLVNEDGVFRRNTDLAEVKSTFAKSANIEKPENDEKPENLFADDAEAPISDFSHFSDFADFATFAKVDFFAEQEHQEGSIRVDDLLDAEVAASVEARIEEELRKDALDLWEKHNWRRVTVDGWPRGGDPIGARRCIDGFTGALLRALLVALAALGV